MAQSNNVIAHPDLAACRVPLRPRSCIGAPYMLRDAEWRVVSTRTRTATWATPNNHAMKGSFPASLRPDRPGQIAEHFLCDLLGLMVVPRQLSNATSASGAYRTSGSARLPCCPAGRGAPPLGRAGSRRTRSRPSRLPVEIGQALCLRPFLRWGRRAGSNQTRCPASYARGNASGSALLPPSTRVQIFGKPLRRSYSRFNSTTAFRSSASRDLDQPGRPAASSAAPDGDPPDDSAHQLRPAIGAQEFCRSQARHHRKAPAACH